MIRKISFFLLLMIISSCGPQRKVRYLAKDDAETSDQGLANSMQIAYSVPDQSLEGNNFTGSAATPYIMISEKKYYVSNNTKASIKNYLITLPPGNHQLNIRGRFSQEQAVVNGTQTMVNVVEVLEIY
ncbi:hypothetical protein N9N67_03110 [Bacteriovoracaceae bacterium]|nr:hypothetical protein [Bacteriovoracaceae bacterium]